MSLVDLISASAIANAIGAIRFDRAITSFDFKPSLGIVAKRLESFAEELGDMREPLQKSVRDVMTISILENFMSGGRPKWEHLAPSTIAKRQKEGSGSMILVRSGSLADIASSEGVWSIGRQTATIRNLPDRVWYGKIHQAGLDGGSFGGGKWFKKYQDAARKSLGAEAEPDEVDSLAMKIFDKRTLQHGAAPRASSSIPARPFVLFQDEDIDDIELIFVEWVEDKVREAGLR
jgi:phage gpG-like protein